MFRSYVAGGARSTVDKVDDTKLMQEMAGNMMAGESRKAVEAPQNYGFTSVCMPGDKDAVGKLIQGAEVAIHYVGGNRAYPIAGAMDDRRHRLKGLDPGDTAMFRTKDDYMQFHFSKDGGFWSGPKDKTVRMALVDKQSGGQGGQGGGSKDGSGGGGSGQGGQPQKPTGQQSVKSDNQQSKLFKHITSDETASGGKNVRHYLDDGVGYYEVNSDKWVYLGALKPKAAFGVVVTTDGPCKNVKGRIG